MVGEPEAVTVTSTKNPNQTIFYKILRIIDKGRRNKKGREIHFKWTLKIETA